MRKVNWERIFVDFGCFTAILPIVAGFLMMARIKLPMVYLNFMLSCGVILAILCIFYVAYSLPFHKKIKTDDSHKHNSYSNDKIAEGIGESEAIHPINVSQNKNSPDDFRYHPIGVHSFLAKVKKRYIQSRIL